MPSEYCSSCDVVGGYLILFNSLLGPDRFLLFCLVRGRGLAFFLLFTLINLTRGGGFERNTVGKRRGAQSADDPPTALRGMRSQCTLLLHIQHCLQKKRQPYKQPVAMYTRRHEMSCSLFSSGHILAKEVDDPFRRRF